MARRRLLLAVLAVLAILAAATAAGLWLLRDQPRRRVALALTQRLGHPVTIAGLSLQGREQLTLHELRIAPRDPSPVGPITIDRIVAEGPLTDMLDARFRSLTLSGIHVALDWCTERDPTPLPTAGGAVVDLLSIDDGTVELHCGDHTISFAVTGRLHDLGSALHGQLALQSDAPRAPLTGGEQAPVVAGDSLEMSLDLHPDRSMSLLAVAKNARLTGHGSLELGAPELSLEAKPDGDHGWDLAATTTAPILGDPSLRATFQRGPWRLVEYRGQATGLAAGSLLDVVAPLAGVALGPADLELSATADGALLVEAALPQIEATLGGERLCAAATIRGDLRSLSPPPAEGLSARLAVDACDGQAASPSFAVLLPVVAVVDAGLVGQEARRLAGELSVSSPSAGELVGHGAVAVGAPHAFELDWSWQGRTLAEALELMDFASGPELQLGGRVSAQGRVVGDQETATARAELTVDDLRLAAGDEWQIEAPTARTLLHWTGDDDIALTLLESPLQARLAGSDQLPASLAGASTLQLPGLVLSNSELQLDGGPLGRLAARAPMGADRWTFEASADELERWARSWPALHDLLPAGDSISGDATVTGSIGLEAAATTLAASWALHHGGYASADGSRVVEELAGRGELNAELAADRRRSLSATAHLGGAQLLWDVLYGDYSALYLDLDLQGLRQEAGGWQAELTAHIDDLASLAVGAAGTADSINWHAEAQVPFLPALWQRAISEPCAGSLGSLENMVLSRGTLQAAVAGSIEPQLTVSGLVTLHELSLALPESLTLSALDAELPVALAWRDGTLDGTAVGHGKLAFEALSVAGLTIPAIHSAVSVDGDSLSLGEALTVPFLGGDLKLSELALVKLLSADRHLEAAVDIDGLRLAELSAAFGLPRLDGRLDGHFPLLRLSPERLSVEGASELELFGGTIILADIAGRDPLSPYPRLELTMAWEGIDLAQLTQTFDFGRVTGIVEGEVGYCELFQGVPLTCSGWLQSTPRPGVDQRISIKAVNNIAILGTGSGLGFLNRGIQRLIDAYPYESLGFSMELQSDQFHLRGLARRGDAELFVKGRFPLRLDVVNARPGTTVSFQSMLARLRQLDFTTIQTQAEHH